ncbi:oligosaccharide flippase family protein [Mongoliibacter ruber]|uniref:O-antigen/teichoic acid export membrane protein n=1 Tax=Mongoliibacter ruber TaxID=1750599 RepID=A0A2T0WNV3_9BACT|nr:oligosaccharide flippase family protein [Mongoliibacter ruber]PRY88381.1 O-antigen/teichoic acid export membrane protein [Mongoliibacter ruber]
MRLASGSFWNAILNFFSKGFSFLGTIIIIRLIGREAFGEFGLLNTTISMFGMFTAFSISQTATKYIAQYRNSDKEKASRIIGISFLFSGLVGSLVFLVVVFFAKSLAIHSLGAPHLQSSLQLMALGVLFGSLNGVQNGIIYGLEAFKVNTYLGIFLGFVLTLIKVLLTYYFGFFGAVVGMTLEPVITYVITFKITKNLMFKEGLTVRFKGSLQEASILFTYSLPTILSGLLLIPTQWYVMTLLARENNGFFELAGYNASLQWFNVLIFVPYIVMAAFLPVFSDLIQQEKLSQVNRVVKNTVVLILGIFVPLSAVFLFFGDKIALIYGSEFGGVGYLLALSIIAMIPQSLLLIFSNLAAAMNHLWFSFSAQLTWSVVLLSFSYLWLGFGAEGLLYARLLAFSVQLLVFLMYYFWWRAKFKKNSGVNMIRL